MSYRHELFDQASPAESRRLVLWTLPLFVLIAAIVVYGITVLSDARMLTGETWSVLFRMDLQRSLMRGLAWTAIAAITATLLSLAVGSCLLLLQGAKYRIISYASRGWIEVARGTPELLMIIFVFLGFPALGIDISIFWALIVGLVLYQAAAIAEVFRAGFDSVPAGQREAAHALGLGKYSSLIRVELAQAIPQCLPNLINEIVRVTKSTSLGFTVGYVELLNSGQIAIEILGPRTSFPIYLEVALIYVVLCLALELAAHTVRRYTVDLKGRGGRVAAA